MEQAFLRRRINFNQTKRPKINLSMEYVRFGNTGLQVSKICLGCMTYGIPTERWKWALNEEQSRPFIKKALELRH